METSQGQEQGGERLIDPKELIDKYSVEELKEYSDPYYKKLSLPEFQMGKPFPMPTEAAPHLVQLGLILENLRIGLGSCVLDSSSYICWFHNLISEPIYLDAIIHN